ESSLYDALVAETRQHLLDVSREGRVGPDHEDVVSDEIIAVVVQDPRSTMQGHGCLTCSGPSLHDEQLFEGTPYEVVLGFVNGLDDVAHLAIAAFVQVTQQGVIDPMLLSLGEGLDPLGQVREDDII